MSQAAQKVLACLLICLLAFPPVWTSAAEEDDIPRVTAVRGLATVQKDGGLRPTTIYKGMEIGSGDVISTDLNASVTVGYFKKEVVVGECSQVSMNDMWNRHDRDTSSIVLMEGMIKNRVDDNLDKDSNNVVRTPNTIAGVRGTEYILIYSRMGLEDGGDENPFTRMRVIEGTVRFDLAGQEEVQSYLVGIDGAKQVSDSITGAQTVTAPLFVPDNLNVSLSDLDASILESIRESIQNDPQMREQFSNLEEILEEKKTQNTVRPEKPEGGVIYPSEADTVLPTLPPPTPESGTTAPPSQPDAPGVEAPPSTQPPSQPPGGETSTGADGGSTPPPAVEAPPGPAQPPAGETAPPPQEENILGGGNSGGGSSRDDDDDDDRGGGGGGGGSGQTEPEEPTPSPPALPDSKTVYIENMTGDLATALAQLFDQVQSTVILSSRNGSSLDGSRSVLIPSGKSLVIQENVTLNLSANLRAEGQLVNQGEIRCNTFINRNGDSKNGEKGSIICENVVISGENGQLINQGEIAASVLKIDAGALFNEGKLVIETGVNTGDIHNTGELVSGEAFATSSKGTIYQNDGSLTVDDEYVITGMGDGTTYRDCGRLVYAGGIITSQRDLVDCSNASHSHLEGMLP